MKPILTLTIKEIAAEAKINPMTVRRNETKWKLDKALIGKPSNKPKLYDSRKVRRILVRQGYLEPLAPA